MSYDDVLPIQEMYAGTTALQYTIGYSARIVLRGREAMFFSDGLIIPEVEGSMGELHRAGAVGLMNELLWQAMTVAGPVLAAALLTGWLICVFQVATQL